MKPKLIVPALILVPMAAWAADNPETDPSTTRFNSIEIQLEMNPRACQALASLEYFQRGAEAEVETSIRTDDCDAASGHYVLHVTVRGDNDKEPRILIFEETWERSDDAPVEKTQRYPIGDDVDLLRIKSRKLSCECADTAEHSAEE